MGGMVMSGRHKYVHRPGKLGWLLLAMVIYGLFMPTPAWAKSASQSYMPEYSRLFEKTLKEHKQGNWRAALITLSQIYETEIPVQVFYDTLDSKKLEILSALEGDTVIITKDHKFELDSLIQFFNEVLLARPELLYHRISLIHDLPPVRLLYLYAVMGEDQKKPITDPLLSPAAPEVNLAKAIASMDPWLVSGALFLARKGLGCIDPAQLLERWHKRPDLWDETCTEQALLFLAGLKPKKLKALLINGTPSANQIRELSPIPENQPARARVLIYWGGNRDLAKSDYLQAASCQALKIYKTSMGKVNYSLPKGQKIVDWCRKDGVTLPPGIYRIKYRNSLMRGGSAPFQLKNGAEARLIIPVRGDV
jgi:hypothetical protein